MPVFTGMTKFVVARFSGQFWLEGPINVEGSTAALVQKPPLAGVGGWGVLGPKGEAKPKPPLAGVWGWGVLGRCRSNPSALQGARRAGPAMRAHWLLRELSDFEGLKNPLYPAPVSARVSSQFWLERRINVEATGRVLTNAPRPTASSAGPAARAIQTGQSKPKSRAGAPGNT
jgi:hypothetical protein